MRFLRHYTSKAKRNHFCDYCMHQIQPGEKYYADVYAVKKHGIIVSKQHADGCPVDPLKEEMEMFKESTKTLEMYFENSECLAEAA